MSRLLSPFMPYIAGALLMAALGLGGYVWSLRAANASLTAENAALARSMAALTQQAADAKLARDVEAARAKRWEARSGELAATIETILTGDFDDAPLDPDLADWLNGLRSGD